MSLFEHIYMSELKVGHIIICEELDEGIVKITSISDLEEGIFIPFTCEITYNNNHKIEKLYRVAIWAKIYVLGENADLVSSKIDRICAFPYGSAANPQVLRDRFHLFALSRHPRVGEFTAVKAVGMIDDVMELIYKETINSTTIDMFGGTNISRDINEMDIWLENGDWFNQTDERIDNLRILYIKFIFDITESKNSYIWYAKSKCGKYREIIGIQHVSESQGAGDHDGIHPSSRFYY